MTTTEWKETTPTLTVKHETTLAGFTCWVYEDGRYNVFGHIPGVTDVMFSGHERTAELAKAKCAAMVQWAPTFGIQGR